MISSGKDRMPDFCNRDFPFHYATALNVLMKMGVDLERVNLLAVGEYENYKGEVLGQKPVAGEAISAKTQIELHIGFSGVVDKLPYQFFYGLTGGTARTGEWEDRARKLMAPFDAAVIRHDAVARYQSLMYAFGLLDRGHIGRYLELFDFYIENGRADMDELLIWASLLPSFHRWAGNPGQVADILGRLFGHRFRIVENVPGEFAIPPEAQYRLGTKAGRLGRESILGRRYGENDSTYLVIISGLRRNEVVDFLPRGTKRRKLEWVLGFCMPSNLDFRLVFQISDRAAVLGRQGDGTYLGYATHI